MASGCPPAVWALGQQPRKLLAWSCRPVIRKERSGSGQQAAGHVTRGLRVAQSGPGPPRLQAVNSTLLR